MRAWGETPERRAGNERERDRVRYRTFQKHDAHALRFGSMNSITFGFAEFKRDERSHF